MNGEKRSQHDEGEIVVTPGGPRPKGRVHLVTPGSAVSLSQEGRAALPPTDASQGSGERSVSAMSSMILTPGGLRPRSRVHLIGPGQKVDVAGGQLGLVDLAARAEGEAPTSGRPGPPSASNWIVYAGWFNTTGSPITSFRTAWRVPPLPAKQAAQLIYLFNGLEPADGPLILQPVLQWGDSGADEDGVQRTGPFWTVASWSVGVDAHHTPHVRVNPGDLLVGVMRLVNQSAGKFSYACEFEGIAGTNHSLVNVSELVWCNETLEAYENGSSTAPPYDLNDSTEYPATGYTAFQHISIQTGSVNPSVTWSPFQLVSKYGEMAVPVSNSSTDGEVDLFYGHRSASNSGGIAAVSRKPETPPMEIWWIGAEGSVQGAFWYEGITGWQRYEIAPRGSASDRVSRRR